MISNYFKTFIRSFYKNKLINSINVLGLSICIAVSAILLQHISFESSYDKFHNDSENIYRFYKRTFRNNELRGEAVTGDGAIPAAIKSYVPGIEDYIRLRPEKNVVVMKDDIKFFEERIYYTDPNFFNFFNFQLLFGDKDNILNEPYTVLLSETYAKNIFGSNEIIGQSIKLDDELYVIKGVFKDIPKNTHFRTNILLSTTQVPWLDQQWRGSDNYLYFKLQSGISKSSVEEKMHEFFWNERGDKELYENVGRFRERLLQKVTDIHLTSNYMFEMEVNGSLATLKLLITVVLLILFFGWSNYINLTISLTSDRAREIGIRKINGASRKQLIFNFFLTSLFLSIVSIIISFIIIIILNPLLLNVLDGSYDVFFKINPHIGILFLVSVIVGSLLSSIYPAFVQNSRSPVSILSGKFDSIKQVKSKKILLFVQIALLYSVLFAVFIFSAQFKYMSNNDLGFDMENILILKGPRFENDSISLSAIEVFKEDLIKNKFIDNVAVSSDIPGKQAIRGFQITNSNDSELTIGSRVILVDENFLSLYDVEFIAGHDYTSSPSLNRKSLIIDDFTARKIGFVNPKEAIGKYANVNVLQSDQQIIGVTKTIHMESLKLEKSQMAFIFRPSSADFISIKLNKKIDSETLNFIKEKWELHMASNSPFDYFYLTDYYKKQYAKDILSKKLFISVLLILIILVIVGLIAYSIFAIKRRTKEIGIRKVLGASVLRSCLHLLKEYLIHFIIAIVTFTPIVYYLMNNYWLMNFPYHIDISPMLIIKASLTIAVIIIVSVSSQVIKIARINPADTIRNE